MRRFSFILVTLVVGSLALVPSTGLAQADNQFAPIAIANLEITTEATDTTPAVITLDGSDSFDPDGSIVQYQWKVTTEAYSWLPLRQASPQSPVATFELPAERLIERFGYSISFRLTVTDDGSPAATDSDTVVLRINQPPVAHIEVFAKLLDRGDEEGHDDNGNGVVDENEERYTVEGVISRPGERGNAQNEWDVGAATLLVIDGSGSFDPDGELPDTSFTWELLRFRGATSVAHSLPIGAQGQSIVGQRMLSTDEDPLTAANSDTETVARLPIVPGEGTEPFFVYYRLTVTDEDGASARRIVKITIENLPNPSVSDFCADRSLGGPRTYSYDSNGDGMADTCSLRDTRRATVARQNALETMAGLYPAEFRAAVMAECANEELLKVGYGDDPQDLANDVCQTGKTTPPPPAVDPTIADVFFSGVISGPHFCANRSLGGPRTYAFDRPPQDGVADTCSLPFTRREAIVRQRALEEVFAEHPQFKTVFAFACATLGAPDFGDDPEDLAVDACNL